MKKSLAVIAILGIATVSLSALDLSYLFKDKSVMGASHGGTAQDKDVMSDGVGVVVVKQPPLLA